VLHVGRTGRGYEAEEHEHEHLAQAEVAVGLRATGVQPPGNEAGQPDRDQPPADRGRQRDPRRCGHPERGERRRADLASGGPGPTRSTGSGRPCRCPSPGHHRSSRWRSWSRPGWPAPRMAAHRGTPPDDPPEGPSRPTTVPTATGTTAAANVRGRAPTIQRRTPPIAGVPALPTRPVTADAGTPHPPKTPKPSPPQENTPKKKTKNPPPPNQKKNPPPQNQTTPPKPHPPPTKNHNQTPKTPPPKTPTQREAGVAAPRSGAAPLGPPSDM